MSRTLIAALAAAAAATVPGGAAAQDALLLDEIVVSPGVAPTERQRSGASVAVITQEELAEAGDVQLGTFLQRLPGISLDQSGPPGTFADLRIRGARSRYISVYIDGILVTDPSTPSRQFEDFGGLSTGGIARIEILKGSQSALYGGTPAAGVINIETLEGLAKGEGIHQRASITAGSNETLAADYAYTHNRGDLSVSFSASRAQSAGFSAADEANGNTEADGYERTRLSFGIESALTPTLTIGANAFVEDGRSDFDEFQSVPPFLPTDGTPGDDLSERETVGWRVYGEALAFGADHRLAVSGYATDRESFFDGFASAFQSERLAVDYVATGQLSDTVQLSAGLNWLDETAEYGALPGGSASTQSYGLFVESVYAPTDRFDLTTALRFDEHSEFGAFTTGRIAFAYRPVEGLVWRGAVATGYRPPAIDELFSDFGTFVGNPDLEPEESLSVELGVDRVFSSGAELSATIFDTQIENLVTFAFGAPSTLENVPGTSTRKGIELAGRLPLGERLTGFGALTLLNAEDANGNPLARVPQTDLVLGAEADFTDALTGRASLQYVGGVEGLEDYTLLDLGLSYQVSARATLDIALRNATDTDYQTVPGYGTAGRSVFVGLRAAF